MKIDWLAPIYLFFFTLTGGASALPGGGTGETKVAPTIVDGKQMSKSEEARAAKLLKSPKKMPVTVSKPKKSPSKIRKKTAAGSPTKKLPEKSNNENNNTTNENNNITNDSNEISSNSTTADPSTNTADPSTNTADPSTNTAEPSTNTADTENTENISEATPLSTNTSDVESEIKPEN